MRENGIWRVATERGPQQEMAHRGYLCILSFCRAVKKYSLGGSSDTSPGLDVRVELRPPWSLLESVAAGT